MDDREQPDSPFLNEALLEPKSNDEWEPLAEALLSDSPFQSALELAATPTESSEEEHELLDDPVFADEEAGVIGGENRVRITNTTGVPWRWICKVEVKGTRDRLPGGGTGLLVSNRHVLTAAHVVHDAFQNMQNFSIEVKPALNYGDEPFGSYAVSSKPKLPRNYRRDATDSLDWDYALLTLDTSIGEKTFSKLQGKPLCFWGSPQCGANSVFARTDPTALNGKAVFTAGYPRSAGAQKLMCAAGILVGVAPTRRTMRITADTTQGQSGSPVWIVQNNRCCLVGIAAGAGKYTNVVVRVTRELVRQVRAWIAQDGETPSMIETEEPLDSAGVALSDPEHEHDEALAARDEALTEWSPESSEQPEEVSGQQPEDFIEQRPQEFSEEGPEEFAEQQPEDFSKEPPEDFSEEQPEDFSDTEDAADRLTPFLELPFAPRAVPRFDAPDDEGGRDDGRESRDADETRSELAVTSDSEAPSDEPADLELDFEHLGLLEHAVGPPSNSATLGFEFDMNFGFETEVAAAKGLSPPAGWRFPSEGLQVTDHEWRDPAGDWKDAIHVTLDAVRMEIATAPIHIDDDSEFNRVVEAVQKIGQELIHAPKTRDEHLDVPGFKGHPTTFGLARTVVNKPELDAHGRSKFPGDAEHASYELSAFPLVIHRMSSEYPTATKLWASPQATVTLPLAEFGALVWEIHKTKGGAAGVAFSGRDGDRLGLRDDLAWLALTRALADRKKKIGKELSDGTKVTSADFTRSITCLVTILVMYMLTGVKKDSRDEVREQFAKGSLPLNIKTPLWEIHKFALTDREKFVFRELYGHATKRENLYALAKPGAKSTDGSNKLFPDYTRWDPERFFATAPTWERLVEAVVDEKPMIVELENRLPKKKHLKGEEILIAPLSSKIVWDKTKPRIAVEMRRLGFAPVHFEKWRDLMKRLRELARKVNP